MAIHVFSPTIILALLSLSCTAAYSELDLEFGKRQMANILADIPAMGAFPTEESSFAPIDESSSLYLWIAKEFAGANTGWPIVWSKSRVEGKTWRAYHWYPTKDQPAMISIAEKYWDEKQKRYIYYGFENLYFALIFELHNIRNQTGFYTLRNRATDHTISREEFIRQIARIEHASMCKLKRFYETIWKPWADRNGFKPDHRKWEVETDFKHWLESSPEGYPETPYSAQFDYYYYLGTKGEKSSMVAPTDPVQQEEISLIPHKDESSAYSHSSERVAKRSETIGSRRWAYGERQVRNMLKSRTTMAFAPLLDGNSYKQLKLNDPICIWMARAFGGGLNASLIAWNDDEPTSACMSSSVTRKERSLCADGVFANNSRVGFIRISGNSGIERPFEEYWGRAIQQILRLSRQREFSDIAKRAKDGALNRENYIAKSLLIEFEIEQEKRLFFENVFLPWATEVGVKLSGSELFSTEGNFSVWVRSARARILANNYRKFYSEVLHRHQKKSWIETLKTLIRIR